MKLTAFFNTVDGTNIGLENLIRQDRSFKKIIIVVKQTRAAANTEIELSYPEADVGIQSANGLGWFRILLNARGFLGRGPSVLHAHHAAAAVLAAAFRGFGKTRLVTTAHANFTSYRVRHKLAFAMAFLMSDRVICNSYATLDSLPWFVSRRKIAVIYNGVDFRKLDATIARTAKRRCDSAIIIGTVCRMVPQKDLPTLIRAFAKAVGRSSKPLRLRLVGDGPQRPLLEQLVRDFGVESLVEWAGSISREQVYSNLVDIDIFVVSSRWEGFCNAMVEAAAAGKPIIASKIDTFVEVLGGVHAIFFEVGNSDSLSVALLRLVDDEAARGRLAQGSRAFVRDRYALEKSAKEYGSVYRELLAGMPEKS